MRESIAASIPGESDRALLEQISITEQDGMVIIVCPNAFTQRYLSRQYKDVIVKSIRARLDKRVDVQFVICPAGNQDAVLKDRSVPEKQEPVQMSLPYTNVSPAYTGLNCNYTFEEFIVGRCNAFAFEAAMALTENSISRYNPLYFYSDIGLGKSHIAHAIGNRLAGKEKKFKVRYTTARDFSQDYVNSIRNNCIDRFENTYSASKLDIFFIDDVHFFKNKEKTQMELCHVMDDLISAGKQVILSGFRPPSTMTQLDQGLRSRFSSGLVIDIRKPDRVTREKIIHHKSRKNGLMLSEEVVEFLGSTITGSVREIDSAVLTLAAMSSLMKRQITLDLAKEVLEGTIARQQIITIDFIQNFIAKNFCISREVLLSPLRKKEIVYPRQVAIYLCRKYTSETVQAISDAFSRKHSSIIHSIETVEDMYKDNLKVKKEIDFLIEKLDSETA